MFIDLASHEKPLRSLELVCSKNAMSLYKYETLGNTAMLLCAACCRS
jgi:hypothetical protein